MTSSKLTAKNAQPPCDTMELKPPVDFDDPHYAIDAAFSQADSHIRKIPKSGFVPVGNLLRLKFYSLYKQATEGDMPPEHKCPSFLNYEGYWKWHGWRQMRGTEPTKCKQDYVKLLAESIAQRSSFVWEPPVDVDEAFAEAERMVQHFPRKRYQLPESIRLEFYALYAQATKGDAPLHLKKKGTFEMAKWEAWSRKKGVPSEKAKRLYCKMFWHEVRRHGYTWHPPSAAPNAGN